MTTEAFLTLAIPTQPDLHAALGRLAIAHTHLELILRYVVKSIAGISVREALDVTNGDRTSDVRDRIKKLFKEKSPTAEEKTKLDMLLGAARRLSEMRNNFLHSAWSETSAGHAVLKGENHEWETAPNVDAVDAVVVEILSLVNTLNDERHFGFIYQVVERDKQRRTAAAVG